MNRKSPYIAVCDADGIRTIEFNRPEKINALTVAMSEAVTDALSNVPERLVVLKGSGSRGFCSGGDLSAPRKGGADVHALDTSIGEMILALEQCPVPIVTVVHGAVLGVGVAIAAMSDTVIADDNTKFRMPEIEFGIYPAPMHPALARRLPSNIVRQMCLNGRGIGAVEALTLGLATDVMPIADAAKLAQRIEFYRDRAPALLVSRQCDAPGRSDGLAAAMREGSARFHMQLETEPVQRILARYRN